MQLRIATRESPLALWQAHHVQAKLQALDPALEVSLVPMTTRGDQWLDQPLAKLGGKGLFLKELEVAMLEQRAELAVHSLKDVPMQLEQPFALAAILAREDARDAFVSNRYEQLDELPEGAIVGTSSLRRQLLLKLKRSDLQIKDLRGNINTRLAKLDRGDFDAIVLASAGLKRLGLGARIRQHLPLPEFVPAAGQASLAIECLAANAEVMALIARLHDPASAQLAVAERSFTRALGGSCQWPIGAWAEVLDGQRMSLHGLVGLPDLSAHARVHLEGCLANAEQLGLDTAALVPEQYRRG
jgi:hydroxymethylbilane synthase